MWVVVKEKSKYRKMNISEKQGDEVREKGVAGSIKGNCIGGKVKREWEEEWLGGGGV